MMVSERKKKFKNFSPKVRVRTYLIGGVAFSPRREGNGGGIALGTKIVFNHSERSEPKARAEPEKFFENYTFSLAF